VHHFRRLSRAAKIVIFAIGKIAKMAPAIHAECKAEKGTLRMR